MSTVIYRRSSAEQTIAVRRSIRTTTSIAAYGSDDGYTTPRGQIGNEFGTDETILIRGSVIADDGASLQGELVQISLNGTPLGTTSLGPGNIYQYNLGQLAEADHIVASLFDRVRRTVAAMGSTILIDEYLESSAELRIGSGPDPIYMQSEASERIRVGILPEVTNPQLNLIILTVDIASLVFLLIAPKAF